MSTFEMVEEMVGGVLVRRGPLLPDMPYTGMPQECTRAQGLVALYALHQITETQLDEVVAQIADPAAFVQG